MTSTPTSRLRLDKQATGDNPNAWGGRVNVSLDLLDEARGVAVIPVNGNVVLTTNNFSSDQARRFTLKFTGTGLAGNAPALVTIPAVDIGYQVHNACAGDVTIGLSSSVAVTVRAGQISYVYSDSTSVFIDDPSLDQIKKPAASLDLNGQRGVGAADGVADSDLATVRQTVPAQSALAKAWAVQPSGEVVAGQGYSALFNANLAKAWATQPTGEVVAGQGYSAYYYAQQTLALGTAGKATTAQAQAGTDNTVWMTPLTTAAAVPKFTAPVASRSAKSAAYTVTAGDRGTVIECTGTFTLSTLAAASAPANFYFYIRKADGGGVVTFDPNGAETIDGRSTINVYQESFLVWTDGTAWYSSGRPKGWISIAEIPVTAVAASLNFSIGFADTEFRDMEFRLSGLSPSATALLLARVSKGGTFLTTNTYQTSSWVLTNSTQVTTLQVATQQFASISQSINSGATVNGVYTLQNFRATTANQQEMAGMLHASSAPQKTLSCGFETTGAAIDGFRLYFDQGANFAATGTVHQRAFRA